MRALENLTERFKQSFQVFKTIIYKKKSTTSPCFLYRDTGQRFGGILTVMPGFFALEADSRMGFLLQAHGQ